MTVGWQVITYLNLSPYRYRVRVRQRHEMVGPIQTKTTLAQENKLNGG